MMFSSMSTVTNYLNPRDDWLSYPPPPLNRNTTTLKDGNRNHVVATNRANSNYRPFDDYLGLSNMLQSMNVTDSYGRSRLGSAGLEIEDDFRSNGVDAEMDEFDRIIHRLRSEDGSPPPNVNGLPASTTPTTVTTVTQSTSPVNTNVLPRRYLYGRGDKSPHERPSSPLPLSNVILSAEDPILSKEAVLELLRERERRVQSRRRHGSGGGQVCVFCRNNGEPVHVYTAHCLKDANGRVTCPVLRAYTCPYCRASGDNAHTKTYCPLATGEVTAHSMKALKTARTSTGKKRRPNTSTALHVAADI